MLFFFFSTLKSFCSVQKLASEFSNGWNVEQDALMSPNPRGKLEDLVVGCVCCLVA